MIVWSRATVFSGEQLLAEVHWRLNAHTSGGGYSAYQLVFGSNPVDLVGWGENPCVAPMEISGVVSPMGLRSPSPMAPFAGNLANYSPE